MIQYFKKLFCRHIYKRVYDDVYEYRPNTDKMMILKKCTKCGKYSMLD